MFLRRFDGQYQKFDICFLNHSPPSTVLGRTHPEIEFRCATLIDPFSEKRLYRFGLLGQRLSSDLTLRDLLHHSETPDFQLIEVSLCKSPLVAFKRTSLKFLDITLLRRLFVAEIVNLGLLVIFIILLIYLIFFLLLIALLL